MKPARVNAGFTLIELLLVIGIISVLLAIGALLSMNLIPRASLTAQSNTVTADLRQQQLKAMMGGRSSHQEVASTFGVHISDHAYTLFTGEQYDPNADGNLVMVVEEPNQISSSFPNNTIIFSAGSGEIANYNAQQCSITIEDASLGETITLTLNQYGIITQ